MTSKNGRKQLPLFAEKGDHNDLKTSKPCELVIRKRSATGKSSVEPLIVENMWSMVQGNGNILLVLCPPLLKNEFLISRDMHFGIRF